MDPKREYKNHAGKIIIISDMKDEVLIATYKAMLRHYNIILKIPFPAGTDWPIYLNRYGEVKDLLREEIRRRRLKLKNYV